MPVAFPLDQIDRYRQFKGSDGVIETGALRGAQYRVPLLRTSALT